jgi:hypothetical protein
MASDRNPDATIESKLKYELCGCLLPKYRQYVRLIVLLPDFRPNCHVDRVGIVGAQPTRAEVDLSATES